MNIAGNDDRWANVRKAAILSVVAYGILAMLSVWVSEFEWDAVVVRFTSDQGRLVQIFTEAKSSDVREAAMEKLADQPTLAKLVIEWTPDGYIVGYPAVLAALDKLTVPELLLKVSFESYDKDVRAAAYRRLMKTPPDFSDLLSLPEEANVRLYANVFHKIRESSIPEEHRERWYVNIAAIVRILLIPRVAEEFGRVENIRTDWEPRSERYSTGVVQGEYVSLSIKVGKSGQPMLHIWETHFPNEIQYYRRYPPKWLSADVDVANFYSDRLASLPQSAHVWFALESKNPDLRRAAIEKLEDQALLGRIAIEDKEWYICETARKRLEKLRTASQSMTMGAAH